MKFLSAIFLYVLPMTSSQMLNCMFIRDCCEEDCCGQGTTWDPTTAFCVSDPGSPGFTGMHSASWVWGCTERKCCESECCGPLTFYNAFFSECHPLLIATNAPGVFPSGTPTGTPTGSPSAPPSIVPSGVPTDLPTAGVSPAPTSAMPSLSFSPTMCEVFNATSEVCITEECKDPKCIPRNVYGKVASFEYFNTCTNYCCGIEESEYCFDRAVLMAAEIATQCPDIDIRGPDEKWCDEADLDPVDDKVGDVDDLVFKIIIRFPPGSKHWNYHIATLVKTCEDGLCVIDPLGEPADNPVLTCDTPQAWAEKLINKNSPGNELVWHDTQEQPPAGKVYIEIAPGDQNNYHDGSTVDPLNKASVEGVCKTLKGVVDTLCKDGSKPFPEGCGKDSDGDGIPDKYDKCPNSPEDADVDYCSEERFGCAEGETPP